MTDKIGIAVVGFPASGKSEVSECLGEITDSLVIETGDIVRDSYAKDTGNDPEEDSSKSLGEYSTMRREEDGGDYVAQDVVSWAEDHDRIPGNAIVISGMRDTESPALFEDYFDTFHIVHVHAPFNERLRRLQERDRQDESNYTKADLAERDGRESMWGTSDLIPMAGNTILNDGAVEDLHAMTAEIACRLSGVKVTGKRGHCPNCNSSSHTKFEVNVPPGESMNSSGRSQSSWSVWNLVRCNDCGTVHDPTINP